MLSMICEGLSNFAGEVVNAINTCLDPLKIEIGWLEQYEEDIPVEIIQGGVNNEL